MSVITLSTLSLFGFRDFR